MAAAGGALGPGSTRLDRLLTLLDTGSTAATRKAAAQQIGDIAGQHQSQLQPLLKKVHPYLKSKSWETRVAAAQALGAIAQSVAHPTVAQLRAAAERALSKAGVSALVTDLSVAAAQTKEPTHQLLAFNGLDILKVLESGAPLVASGGQEYDIAVDSGNNPRERAARQKHNLQRRLGLDGCEQFLDMNDIIGDEDLLGARDKGAAGGAKAGGPGKAQMKQGVQDLVAHMAPPLGRSLSAREANLLKRKSRSLSKQSRGGTGEEPPPKKSKGRGHLAASSGGAHDGPSSSLQKAGKGGGGKEASEVVEEEEEEEDGSWPFALLCEHLIVDMFDAVWEVRHGSIMALRDILASHAASAGVTCPPSVAISSPPPAPVTAKPELQDTGAVAAIKSEVDVKGAQGSSSDTAEEEAKKVAPLAGPVKGEAAGASTTETKPGVAAEASTVVKPEPGAGAAGGLPETDSSSIVVRHVKDETLAAAADKHEVVEAATAEEKQREQSEVKEGSPEWEVVQASRRAEAANRQLLEDCTVRLLCVFALDRFGDFVSDQVVAPVRETSAQALGAVAKHMPRPLLHETLSVLLQMQGRPEWEVRHGSLLGIKYLTAVRQDMVEEMLPRLLPACMAGLCDADDDVRAVAADALAPAASVLVGKASAHVAPVLASLWDIMLDLDDLSPSTGSVMNLLAEIYLQPGLASALAASSHQPVDLDLNADDDLGPADEDAQLPPLAELAPRLWPFLRHNVTAVRHAAIRTLERLLDAGGKGGGAAWVRPILAPALRLVFQNLLLESDATILSCSKRVWHLLLQSGEAGLVAAARPHVAAWVQLAAAPSGKELDRQLMYAPYSAPASCSKGKGGRGGSNGSASNGCHGGTSGAEAALGGTVPKHVVGADGESSAVAMRVVVAEALGQLAAHWQPEQLSAVVAPLQELLTSDVAIHRQVAGMVITAWCRALRRSSSSGNGADVSAAVQRRDASLAAAAPLRAYLLHLLSATDPSRPTPGAPTPYLEMERTHAKLRSEAAALLKHAQAAGVDPAAAGAPPVEGMGVDAVLNLAMRLQPAGAGAGAGGALSPAMEGMESCRQRLLLTAGYLRTIEANMHTTVLAALAGAVTWMGDLPGKLNPLIQPLMTSIKREHEEVLQLQAAVALAEIVARCIERKPSPNDKLLRNICSLACADPVETPPVSAANGDADDEDEAAAKSLEASSRGKKDGGKGGASAAGPASQAEREEREGRIMRCGAVLTLRALADAQGPALFKALPRLWDCATDALPVPPASASEGDSKPWLQTQLPQLSAEPALLASNLRVLQCVAKVAHPALHARLLSLLPAVFACIRHPHAAVRTAASKCTAAMAQVIMAPVMAAVIAVALPMLGDSTSEAARRGAARLVSALVTEGGASLAQYASQLVVPLLARMADPCERVRQSVTRSFATLVPLLPLSRGLPPPPGLDHKAMERAAEDARFLEQLLDNKQAEDYQLHIPLQVTLRRYQQEGINWLAFLKRFGLHGCLCDDMGLGKTLQASAIIASDTVERARAFAKSGGRPEYAPLPSLVVCPPTLVAHWAYEVEKFIPSDALRPVQYAGFAVERARVRAQVGQAGTLVVTSYEVLRAEVELFAGVVWNYCVLDEGHVIKNGKSKLAQAAKRIPARHRLLLSGTPIQVPLLCLHDLSSGVLFWLHLGRNLATLALLRAARCRPKVGAAPGHSRHSKGAGWFYMLSEYHQLDKALHPFLKLFPSCSHLPLDEMLQGSTQATTPAGGFSAEGVEAAVTTKAKGLKSMLNNLEELWDDSHYAEEYNLDAFVSRLGS
eukprot:jgi/Mesen1/5941/ME000301S05068